MRLFRQIYQYVNFCGTTPCQIALAQYMQQHPEHIQELSQFYQTKRDRFNQAIHNSRFCLTHRKELISKTLITARLDLT